MRDGLPNRLIHDAVETASGEYWIATGGGVSRFYPVERPGHGHFENFRIGAGTEANHVLTLMEDSSHVLWVGTEGGLFRATASSKGMAFEEVPLRTGAHAAIAALAEDGGAHHLWAGGIDGLYLRTLDGQIRHFGPRDGVPLAVKAIHPDNEKLWVGGEGLASISLSPRLQLTAEWHTVTNGKPIKVSSLYCDHTSGDLWIGGLGLTRLRREAAHSSVDAFGDSGVLNKFDNFGDWFRRGRKRLGECQHAGRHPAGERFSGILFRGGWIGIADCGRDDRGPAGAGFMPSPAQAIP